MEHIVLWRVHLFVEDEGGRLLGQSEIDLSQIDMRHLLVIVLFALAYQELAATWEEDRVARGGLDAGAGTEELLNAAAASL